MKIASQFRNPILIFSSLVLAALTIVGAAIPIRVLRKSLGGGPFWTLSAILVISLAGFGVYPLAAIILVHTILVGTYAEFEERDFTIKESLTCAFILAFLFLSSTAYAWTVINSLKWKAQLVGAVSEMLTKVKSSGAPLLENITSNDIIAQMPSAVAIMLVISLALSLVFERVVSRTLGLKAQSGERLADFSAPDFIIWLFIGSLLGTFGELGSKPVELISINVLNFSVVIYFFQGVSVLSKYFETFRVSTLWRAFWLFVFIIQVPILLALVGVIDFWADFRKSFVRKAADIRKKRLQD